MGWCSRSAFGEVLVESYYRLDAFVEVVEAVVLVGRVYGVLAEAEAHEYRLDAEHFLEPRDDRNRAARAHGDGEGGLVITWGEKHRQDPRSLSDEDTSKDMQGDTGCFLGLQHCLT